MYKATSPSAKTVLRLINGATLAFPSNTQFVQNTRRKVSIKFMYSGAVTSTVYLYGGFYSHYRITTNGGLVGLTEYGGESTVVSGGFFMPNNWYTLVIDEWDGSANQISVYINGQKILADAATAPSSSPLSISRIGAGRTDVAGQCNQNTLYLEYFKVEYNNLLVYDIRWPEKPPGLSYSNLTAASGGAIGTIMSFSSLEGVEWSEIYSSSAGIPPIDLTSATGTFYVDYRPSRLGFYGGMVKPILTKNGTLPDTKTGIFLTQGGRVLIAKDWPNLEGAVPSIYPAVRNNSGSTRHLGFPSWTCTSNAVWSVGIEFAVTQGQINFMQESLASWGTVQLLSKVNSSLGLISLKILDASNNAVILFNSFSTTLLTSTQFTLQPDTFYLVEVASNSTDWVIKLNGTTIATGAASAIAMNTYDCLSQTPTGTTRTSAAVYFKQLYFTGGTYTDSWTCKSFNTTIFHRDYGTSNRSADLAWYSWGGRRIMGYDATQTYWHDTTGNLMSLGARYSIADKQRHLIKIVKTSSSLDFYFAEYWGASYSVDNNLYLAPFTWATANNYIIANLSGLDQLLDGGFADLFEVGYTNGAGVLETWKSDGTSFVSSVSTSRNLSLSGVTYQNIADPMVKVIETGQTFLRLSDIDWNTLTNTYPALTVEVSGFTRAAPFSPITNNGTTGSVTIRAAAGGEFYGKLYDDNSAVVQLGAPGSTFVIRSLGNRTLNLTGISFEAVHNNQSAILGDYFAGAATQYNVQKCAFVGNTGTTSRAIDLGVAANIVDTIVYEFGTNGINSSNSTLLNLTRVTAAKVGRPDTSAWHVIQGTAITNVNGVAVCIGERSNSGQDFNSLIDTTKKAVASERGHVPLRVTRDDFIDFDKGDLRIKTTSPLYESGIGAFTLEQPTIKTGSFPSEIQGVSGTSVDGVSPTQFLFNNAIQEVIKAFQTAANISSTRTQSKDISVTYAVLANIVQSILQEKGITKSFSDIANEITGIAGSKTVTNYRNVIAQVVASASAGSKTTLSNIAINAAINAQYTHLALMGAMGTFATQVSVIRTIIANKTAVATYGSQAHVSRTGSQTKTTTKAHTASGTFSSTRTTQKGVSASFITTGIATRQGSQTKQVTKGGATSAVESSLFYASKTVTKGYASSANITRWSTYIKLYEILGTFFSSGVFSSNSPGGSKTATGSYTRSATANTVRTTSKHMEKSFSDLATVSSLRVARKEVALPLTPSSATTNTNYTIEKTSYVGYNTYLVITSEMRGTSKDVAKKLATYITQSDSIIKYTSAVTSIEQYSVKLFRNTAEYQTQQISEYSLGESNVIAASVTYKTQSSSIARY